MNKIHINRLHKLTEHLRNGKLGHKRFDFAIYNGLEYGRNEPFSKNGCGTVGCALGECPVIFKDWKFKGELKRPLYKDFSSIYTSAETFFNLTDGEYAHLFIPRCQQIYKFSGKKLNNNATKEQVAANIEAFIKLKNN